MILLDSRVGSKHLAPLLGSLATLVQLDSADVAFSSSSGISIGIEIKTVGDAVNCMFSGRLVDRQIPLMREQYSECYLVIEGLWRSCPKSGVLQVAKGHLSGDTFGGRWIDATSGRSRLMAKSFEQWLTTLELQGGMRIRHTSDTAGTATTILSLYSWWQREDHASFKVMQEPRGAAVELSRPVLTRRILALLPGVGWERSAVLAQRFKTVRQMVDAALDEWYIEGQIAEHSAVKIQRALNGEDN